MIYLRDRSLSVCIKPGNTDGIILLIYRVKVSLIIVYVLFYISTLDVHSINRFTFFSYVKKYLASYLTKTHVFSFRNYLE